MNVKMGYEINMKTRNKDDIYAYLCNKLIIIY